MILKEHRVDDQVKGVTIWCQGCERGHYWPVPRWTYNGNPDKPTMTPSLRLFYVHPETKVERTICHIVVTDGMVHFCPDSDHQFKGQTLPLQQIPDGYGCP